MTFYNFYKVPIVFTFIYAIKFYKEIIKQCVDTYKQTKQKFIFGDVLVTLTLMIILQPPS